jgi:hypothetical protein
VSRRFIWLSLSTSPAAFEVVVELRQAARAEDHRGHGGLLQQPSERDGRLRDALRSATARTASMMRQLRSLSKAA